mgnify:CR=1 FL=1
MIIIAVIIYSHEVYRLMKGVPVPHFRIPTPPVIFLVFGVRADLWRFILWYTFIYKYQIRGISALGSHIPFKPEPIDELSPT